MPGSLQMPRNLCECQTTPPNSILPHAILSEITSNRSANLDPDIDTYIRVAYAGDLLDGLDTLRRSSFIDNAPKFVERKEKGSRPSPPFMAP